MHKITVLCDGYGKVLYADTGSILASVLTNENIALEHPCSFKGICKKCTVEVNGKRELSCRYVVKSDITVVVNATDDIATASAGEMTGSITDDMHLCVDIGTTTLVCALADENGSIVKSVTRNNPQRAFAADVMSRIEYASKGGLEKLNRVLIDEINIMVAQLLDYAKKACIDKMYVAGNTTMLHLFFNVDPTSMGYAPYEPAFLDEKRISAAELGIKGTDEIVALPGISAFVGADIVAGLSYVKFPPEGKYSFFVDLGTNAEVALYTKRTLYCTAAAAGPCFEGVNIECGMSATEGAICSISRYGYETIGKVKAKGICATGLIDAIAFLRDNELLDETGLLEDGEYAFEENVKLKQADIRQFQLAKSAICSAMEALVKKAGITYEAIDKVYVAGGFSSRMSFGNALRVGLFPKKCEGKLEAVNNSCLLGLAEYEAGNDLSQFTEIAQYVDLATDEYFGDLFIENMEF